MEVFLKFKNFTENIKLLSITIKFHTVNPILVPISRNDIILALKINLIIIKFNL